MKKLFFILIPSLLLAVVLFLTFQYVMNQRSQKGALQVTSSPVSKVYLGDKYLGQTPLCKCDSNDMVIADEYTIRLVPVDSSLQEFQEKVNVSAGVLTVVDRKFGKDALSEGSIISLSPLSDKTKTEMVVVSFPEGALVSLDDNDLGAAPLSFKNPTESDHLLKVTKNGYKDKTIRIRTPLGFKLTVAVYLSIGDGVADTTPTPSASVSADLLSGTPGPSVSPTGPQPSSATKGVVILDTPTGFLRVRESNSVSSAEVGKVNPGETYPLVDEKDGWFEIKLTDGKTGWISSDYAKKQ